MPIASAAFGVAIVLGIAAWAVATNSDDSSSSSTTMPLPSSPPPLEAQPRTALPGQPAPGFTLPELDGDGEVSLAELRGRPVVLNFWASWCIPCRSEFPALAEAADEYPEVEIVGITWDDILSDARDFADEMNATWTLLDDPDEEVAEAYGVRGIPQTLFITPDGVVQERVFLELSSDELDGFIENLLAASDAGTRDRAPTAGTGAS